MCSGGAQPMRVAVVGAGMAGLAAGRELVKAGHSVVVFEKQAEVGGRLKTVRVGDFVFDVGATSVAPRGKALQQVIEQDLDQADLTIVQRPVFVHDGRRASPGDPHRSGTRYVYRSGMARLATLLATGLEVRLQTPVDELRAQENRYMVHGEAFDAVVLCTLPSTSAALVSQIGEHRPLSHSVYRKCISVQLGYRRAWEPAYFALVEPTQQQPLTWVSVESAKCEGRAPEGCCALAVQLSPRQSARSMDKPDEAVVKDTLIALSRVLGGGFDSPEVTHVERWAHSQPEAVLSFGSVNWPGSRVLVAGDSVAGGRVELAYESGMQAARLLGSA